MKLWVTAGGTGSAWHICSIVKEYFADEIELYVSDINDPDVVAASTLADHYIKSPLAKDAAYPEFMYGQLNEHDIDVIIPLIPWEQGFFSSDNEAFAKLRCKSLAPARDTDKKLNNKVGLFNYCKAHDIPTIQKYSKDEIKQDVTYFIKPLEGFGAAGARTIKGSDITDEIISQNVIQEYCAEDGVLNEITVEAFWDGNQLHTIGRRRLEAKAGVCTKAKIVDVPEARKTIESMVSDLTFPPVFNVQFVNHNGLWKVMDVNLRLAAGTGLSCAAGFQLIRALLTHLLGKTVSEELFKIDKDIVSILRVYQEVVIR